MPHFPTLILLICRYSANQCNKISALFQKFKNTVCTLRANEIKLTSEKAFITDIFLLRGQKESKYDKIKLFWSSWQSLEMSLNT